MEFRNDIQGIRALAFLLVFIFHLNYNWLPGGFIGVDVFFVISGYLMTSIIIGQKDNHTFQFYDFYLKRLKRIFPAYLFLIISATTAGFFVYLSRDFWTLQKSAGASASFVSNLLFSRGDSYFGAKLEDNPFLHTWSLSIEMQFYFLLPLLLMVCKKKYLPRIILLLIILFTIYTNIGMSIENDNSSQYFSLISRIPEFLIGAFYSLTFKKKINFNRFYNNIFASLSLLALLLSAILINKNVFFPGVLALIPTIATANLLVSDNNFISDFFAKKAPVYIGELSYSLYLWHWPIIAFIRYYNDDYVLTTNEIIFIGILTFVLSWFSYQFIERFFRKKSNSIFIRSIVSGGVLLILITLLLPKATQSLYIPDIYTSPTFGMNSHNQKKIEFFGDKKSKNNQILLIGDSHALNIKPFLDYIGRKNDFAFSTVTTDGLPALTGIGKDNFKPSEMKFYDASQQLAVFTQQNINKNKIILINAIALLEPKTGNTSVYIALEKVAQSLKPNQKLVVFNTFPAVDRDPVKINRDYLKKTSKKFKIIDNPINRNALKKFAATYKNVYFYDLSKSKVFKNAPFYKDTLIYYNRSHINYYGSIFLAKDLEKDFMSFLKPIIDDTK